jgi:uncharacterized membrane protein
LAAVGLLVVVFVRLALNPAVLSYHPRAAFPIFNWYLYTYGIGTACLFAAARTLATPRNRVLGHNVRPLLYTLGTVLAFFTVNIVIADYFSTPGVGALTFQFSGNFARDELQHRMGFVRSSAAHCRHPADRGDALRRPGVACASLS